MGRGGPSGRAGKLILTDHDWIDTPAGVASLVRQLAGLSRLAVDTEFHRERSYYPQVGLLQIAGPGVLALVDTVAVDPAPLGELLTDDVTIVMHAASQDIEALDRVCGVVPSHIFDTQIAAGFVGYRGPSLAVLVERELGLRLPKADRLTDWLRRPLTPAVRRYAAADVAHLLEVADRLQAKLVARGRLEWAEDECEEIRQRATGRRDPEEAWWRIKEARQLRGSSLRLGQALAAWRERVGAETDQPPRFVLPDLALVGIAQRPPATADDLTGIRGLDGRHLRGGQAETILEVVASAQNMKQSDVRLPPARREIDRELRPAATVASAWIAQVAKDLDVETSLLATRSDIEEFLLGSADGRLRHGWRRDVIGDRLHRLVAGEAALALDGRGGLVLEARSGRDLP